MRKIPLLVLSIFVYMSTLCALDIQRIEPPNWWDGMEKDTLSLLIYGDDFRDWNVIKTSGQIKLISAEPYANHKYFKATIRIRRSGVAHLEFRHAVSHDTKKVDFPIYKRSVWKPEGMDGRDVVYLLMPDRFADGDKSNNIIADHQDPVRPEHRWGRRGGDLRGVMDHVNYFKELGVTALWMTPVYENNYINCYHGYTPTDLYSVEPHFGSMDDYAELVKLYHKNGIKIIQDHIVNHISPSHPIAMDPPNVNWINGTVKDHQNCNYRIQDVTDVYGTEAKKKIPVEGWFAGYLADMDLGNPEVVEYWINHAVWWIETFHLDGIREDTYAYSDLKGLSAWGRALKREYPDLYLLGEIMEFDKTRLAYFFRDGLENGLDGVTDFGVSSQIYQLILEELPMKTFYENMANDFIYKDPNNMLVFMDNHDMGRFFSACNKNITDYINAFTLIFSIRGIPQIYYGNEIGMSGGHDPENRNEFPGGFGDHNENAFKRVERTAYEQLIFSHFQKFIKIRQAYPNLFLSEMTHDFTDSIYMLAREDKENSMMMLTVYNSSKKSGSISYHSISNGRSLFLKEVLKSPLSAEVKIDKKAQEIVLPAKESAIILFGYEK